MIISSHRDKLLNIPVIQSLKDSEKLQETYGQGVPATGYQQLLALTIVNKLTLIYQRYSRVSMKMPIAMEAKVGWVVSGPTDMVSESLYYHSLKIDSNVSERHDYGLVNAVKNFWNNDSIGISSNTVEQGAIEKCKDEVKFTENRCKPNLPVKEGHSPLPDGYSLSQKRLTRQLNRLKEDMEIAQ